MIPHNGLIRIIAVPFCSGVDRTRGNVDHVRFSKVDMDRFRHRLGLMRCGVAYMPMMNKNGSIVHRTGDPFGPVDMHAFEQFL